MRKVKVVMIHIGGYPNKYAPRVKQILKGRKTSNFYFWTFSHIKSDV